MIRITCISDTHCRHFRKLDLPEADVLVHTGDLTMNGDMGELYEAVEYIMDAVDRSRFKYVIFIAGNHDFAFREHPIEAKRLMVDNGIIYLQDSQVTLDSYNFYGTPWSPTFMQWAFMKERGAEIRKVWDAIPTDTNVLLTHTPPRGVLDQTVLWNDMVGCEELKDVVFNKLPDLQVHVFGHIHEGYGQWMDLTGKEKDVHFVNACRVNAAYSPINEPVVVQINEPRRTQ